MRKIQLDDQGHLAIDEQGSGSPLLMVHGFPFDRTMWQAQVQALSPSARVITVDLRGFGESSVSEGTVSMAQFADDLAAVVEACGIDGPVTVCGLSMGGYIAWEFWKRHRSRTAALILCDTRAAADDPTTARGREIAALRVLDEGPEFLLETMIPKLFAAATRQAQPDLVASIEGVIRKTLPAGIAAASRGMAGRSDFTGELASIDVPVLLLCGEDDVITPVDEMRRVAAALPQAELVTIPRAGHLSPLENAAAVNEAMVKFLAQR